MTTTSPPGTALYGDVVGQERALATLRASARRPVHAYLLVGPAGTGKRAAAVSFAAALLCPTGGDHGDHGDHGDLGLGPDASSCDTCGRVLAGVHPDVVPVEREGAFIGIDTAREVTRVASMSPVEGDRKVVILHDFHLVRDTGPALLKTIEEPPPSTVFVVLAEYLPPELVTIASRCVRVDFHPLSPLQVAAALEAEGVDPSRARELADAASGRLDRARLLAADGQFQARRQAWRDIPARLDGTGATAARLADQFLAFLDDSVEPLKARHATEMDDLLTRNQRAAEVVSGGGKGGKKTAGRATKAALNSGVKELEERQRRAERRQRTDELRSGLSTLANAYRERLATASDVHRRRAAIDAIAEVDKLSKDLAFNPGELLALQALLVKLGRIALQG